MWQYRIIFKIILRSNYMKKPDLTRIVDTYVKIDASNIKVYLQQLKKEILPQIRAQQRDGKIRWFSFLLHGSRHLQGRESNEKAYFIHLRIEPSTEITTEEFAKQLPTHFKNPIPSKISEMSGVDRKTLEGDDWAQAWAILGEASEWILSMLERHKDIPSVQQIVQYLHFLTNPLMIGHRCLFIPGGYFPF